MVRYKYDLTVSVETVNCHFFNIFKKSAKVIAKSNIITVSCSRESVKNNGKIYDKRVKNSAVINNKIK